jgi:hypothetical protein
MREQEESFPCTRRSRFEACLRLPEHPS